MFEVQPDPAPAPPPSLPDGATAADDSVAEAGDEFGDVSGVVLAHLVGTRLADLDATEDSVTGDAELVDLAIGLSRLVSWGTAQGARVIALLVQRAEAELARLGRARHGDSHGTGAGASHRYDDRELAERTVSTDLSLGLGITSWAADREVELAVGLADHPALARALAAGRLDRRRSELVLEEVSRLDDPADQQEVVRAVVGDGSHAAELPERRPGLIRPLRRPGTHLQTLPPAVLRRAIRQECAERDAEQFIKREAAARSERRVEVQTLPDCMAELRIVAPGYAVAAASTNLDLAARAARRRGDGRTLDQLRCDIGIGWLTEGAFGTLITRPADPADGANAGLVPSARAGGASGGLIPSGPSAFETAALAMSGLSASRETTPTFVDDDRFRVELPRPRGALIVVSMRDTTARGLDDRPATLHGPGGPTPLPAPVARRIAHDERDATWIGLYTDPRTGVATDISRGYRPPPRQRTFITLRDGLRSRLPSSTVRRIELDHVVPYDHERPARGGQTTASNLASAGLREHHLKTDGMLTVTGEADGRLTYTTHTGHAYVSWPELWDDPPTYLDTALPTDGQRDPRRPDKRPELRRASSPGAVDPPY